MVDDVAFTPERFDRRSPDMSSREAWGGVPAWRIRNLRIALIDAEQRGADPADSGSDLSHRALRRRFDRGRQGEHKNVWGAQAETAGIWASFAAMAGYHFLNVSHRVPSRV